jgi:uncharacterized membrane protein
MADKPIFVYVATYASADDAWQDYQAVKQLHRDGVMGTYDAAIISKDADGTVHVSEREKPTEYGAWAGLAVGALIGLFFPPYMIYEAVAAGALVGAGTGALVGHVYAGLPREDMKQIGQMLNEGSAALVVVGESELKQALGRAVQRATKQFETELSADTKQFNQALDQTVNDMLKDS